MRVRTIVTAVAVAVVALFGVAYAILASIDFNQYRQLIAEQVKAATGRELTIKGDLKLAIGLSPAVAVNDVAFANAPWGSRPTMVEARRFEAQMRLLPLLFGEIQVDRIVLIDADILLETDKQGRGNWQFVTDSGASEKAEAAPSAEGGPMRLPTVNEVTIRDAKLTYRDGKTGETTILALQRALLAADGPSDRLRLDMEGAFNKLAFHVEGELGSVAALSGSGAPFPVNVEARIADVAAVKVDGVVRDPVQMRGAAFKASAEGAEIGAFSGLSVPGVATPLPPIPALGPFRVAVEVAAGDDGRPSVPALKIDVGRPDLLAASVEGSIRDPLAARGIALVITADSPDLAAATERFAGEKLAAGPLKLAAKLADAGAGRYALTGLTLTVGSSDVMGDAQLATGGARPAITANLVSKQIDLAMLAGVGGAQPAEEKGGGAPGGESRVFSNEPLPFDALAAADAEIRYRADKVLAKSGPIGSFSIVATLRGGELALRPIAADLAGGKMTGDLAMSARDKALTGKLDVKGVNLGALLKQLAETTLVRDGKTDLALNFRGAGPSMHAVMSSLEGGMTLHVGEGELESRYIELLGADVVRVLSPLADSKAQTKLNCVVGRIDVKAGVATPRVFVTDTGKMVMTGEGKVDLGAERLELTFTPRPKEASLLSLAIPINVTGSLTDPSFRPDTAAAVGRAAGVAAGALLLGPAGVIVPFLSTGQGGGDICAQALKEAGLKPAGGAAPAQPSPAQPQAQPQPAPAQPGQGDPLKELERGIRDLLKR